MENLSVGVGDGDIQARRGQHAGDAPAHQPGTHDGGTGEPVRGQHAVYPPSRYITWPV
ncbi:Uncharacterised protein [Mycobacterium tuberculosis]|uniref:Uncharacterized protein n=1 Tax=Mycobacterium tuberculosis TaxID=1773 RepID=A0A916PAL5_MYCTX|nr:Uncharacterised protein [Mycobacterium tuberculosis]